MLSGMGVSCAIAFPRIYEEWDECECSLFAAVVPQFCGSEASTPQYLFVLSIPIPSHRLGYVDHIQHKATFLTSQRVLTGESVCGPVFAGAIRMQDLGSVLEGPDVSKGVHLTHLRLSISSARMRIVSTVTPPNRYISKSTRSRAVGSLGLQVCGM